MMPHTSSVATRHVMPTTAPLEEGVFIGRPTGTADDDGFPRHVSSSGELEVGFEVLLALAMRCFVGRDLVFCS